MTEINPNDLSYKAFHGCYEQKQCMASKCSNVLDCLAFFCWVRTLFFSWMDKLISWQWLVFFCFIHGQREMCLSLGQVVSKIYSSTSNFYLPWTIGQRFCRTLWKRLERTRSLQPMALVRFNFSETDYVIIYVHLDNRMYWTAAAEWPRQRERREESSLLGLKVWRLNWVEQRPGFQPWPGFEGAGIEWKSTVDSEASGRRLAPLEAEEKGEKIHN